MIAGLQQRKTISLRCIYPFDFALEQLDQTWSSIAWTLDPKSRYRITPLSDCRDVIQPVFQFFSRQVYGKAPEKRSNSFVQHRFCNTKVSVAKQTMFDPCLPNIGQSEPAWRFLRITAEIITWQVETSHKRNANSVTQNVGWKRLDPDQTGKTLHF